MNRAAESIGSEQRLQVLTCIANAQAGLLPPGMSVADCIAAPSGKLQQVIAAASDSELRTCLDTPDFGYSTAQDVTDAVLGQEIQLATEIFGLDQPGAILPLIDRAGSRCQAAVAKNYRRLVSERMRAFITCKTDGLGVGRITSAAGLQECFDAIAEDADGRIQKAFLKLAKDVVKRCSVVDIAAAFPGECADAPDFLTCVQERISCRTCIAINAVDGVMEPCDVFDNGEVDRSCVDPRANECEGEGGGHDCDANASCTDEEVGFQCTCNDGYRGDGTECTDINECRSAANNDCHANATCTNKPGGYDCACKAGYEGDGFSCSDQNECLGEGSGNNCSADATCTNVAGSFLCTCKPGYAGDGVSCVDINECVTGANNCSANGSCTNLIGSFSCACNAGFAGNGVTCTDLNECIGENGGNNCSANGTCTNLQGTFSCACKAGFSGNGVTCTDINECALNTDNCSVNATCTNLAGSFSCSCLTGFSGNGVTCTDQNECFGQGSGNNCSVNANCTNLPGTYSCACKPGFDGNAVGGTCNPINVALSAPTHGSFTTASSTTASGTVTANPISSVSLKINGITVPINSNGTFSASIPLSSSLIFNGIRAELTQNATGFVARDRNVVIWGDSYTMGGSVPQSVGLRITDTGFNALEPVLESGVNLDLNTLIPPGTSIMENVCVQDSFLGCIARATARIKRASSTGFGVDVNSQTNYVSGDVRINGISVDIDLWTTITGITSHCDYLNISADRVNVIADYTLEPNAPNVTGDINVNLASDNNVVWTNYRRNLDCGGTGFQTFIIDLAVGDAKDMVTDGIKDFLKDPDGGGAQDAPIAQAIEDALAAITLAGPIGDAFGVNLSTPLFSLPEDVNGITLGSNAVMTPKTTAPGAPVFSRTLKVNSTFPQSQLASATSPGGQSYGLALVINDSAFNQVLASQIQSGLLQTEISEIEIVAGTGVQPITAGLVSLIIPEFGQLPEDTPLRIKLVPTIAPILTGQTGPAGELAVLKISHIQVLVLGPGNVVYGEIAADMETTFDMNIGPGNTLVPSIGTPTEDDVTLHLLANPLGASETQIRDQLLSLLLPAIPSLGSALGSFPLPSFLGVTPTPVEIERVGTTGFMGVYMRVQ
ncbi:MAG TPA: EGF domain-containing protein [Candidatus Limnocylindrales bacterium]|nr:EGF domain-containing protein [Candidatus Limnocylindrales bacterium]